MRSSKLLALMFVLGCGLSGGPAMAAGLNVLGFDDMSCAAWIKSGDDPEMRNAYVAWVRGFITGHNYALPGQQVSTISSATVEMYVKNYCARNPKAQVSEAAQRLSDEFSGRNQPIRK